MLFLIPGFFIFSLLFLAILIIPEEREIHPQKKKITLFLIK